MRLRDSNTIKHSKKNVVDAAVKTEMHIKQQERQNDVELEKMHPVEGIYQPSRGHLGKGMDREEFET